MKYLVVILVAFLLLASQALAQKIVPDSENLINLPGFILAGKPVICGPMTIILDRIAKFNEVPAGAWIDPERGNNVVFYLNVNTGTTTVVERLEQTMCIISQGVGGIVVSLPKKTKRMPIK